MTTSGTADSTEAECVHLFSPLEIRGVRFRNRIGIAPMCQYTGGDDGRATDWHLVHLGARATGGAGLVLTEATAVLPEGRISPHDLGLWEDSQIAPLRRVTDFIREHGAVPGIQLAHAGRKASRNVSWEGGDFLTQADGGWPLLGPSALPYDRRGRAVPAEMTLDQIRAVLDAFTASAVRAAAAGFEVIELHGAHGYLHHSFLSPLANVRTDGYGGSFENRVRFTRETVRAIRAGWGDRPLFVRLSVVDGLDGGWTVEDSVRLTKILRDEGVDFVDCTSGGILPGAPIFEDEPNYQVHLAETLRAAGMPTAAVGGIADPREADAIIRDGRADLVLLGRESLRDASWPLRAARELGDAIMAPKQYFRGYAANSSRVNLPS